jgi:hypothetical protein
VCPLWLNLAVHFLRAGFRAVFRQPALILGEIAWRWAFGAAAWTLVVVAVHRVLATVDITQIELLIARRSDIFLIADACARILSQVLPQLARECLVLLPAICVMWIAAATVGRAVTLNALLPESEARNTRLGSLAVLHTARAVFALATIIAFFGAMFLAGNAMPALSPSAAAVVWFLLAALVAFCWSVVNWFLALAPIWIVRDGRTAPQSVADSLDLYRRNPGSYVAVGWWFGWLRVIALAAVVVAAIVVSAAADSIAAAVAGCVALTLIYFAVADVLYIARLAAFVALEESSQLSAISSQPTRPATTPVAAPEL